MSDRNTSPLDALRDAFVAAQAESAVSATRGANAYARAWVAFCEAEEARTAAASPAPTPARGDIYRHASTGDEWVVCALDADAIYLAGARPCLGLVKPLTMSRERFAAEMEGAS